MKHPHVIERIMESLRRFPGVGPKMAERFSYYILKAPLHEINELLQAIQKARDTIHICGSCFNLSEEDPCSLCSDTGRDRSMLCVVETPQDLVAISQVKNFNGMYFVLGGALSPLDGIGPDALKVKELINRIKKDKIAELIIATNADAKGETTALYLSEHIKPLGTRVTRLGYGLPVGGDLEYADEVTLSRAIEGRREMY